jgi:hypothetical protein
MANSPCGAPGTATLDKLSVQLGNPALGVDGACACAFANGTAANTKQRATQRTTLVFIAVLLESSLPLPFS